MFGIGFNGMVTYKKGAQSGAKPSKIKFIIY